MLDYWDKKKAFITSSNLFRPTTVESKVGPTQQQAKIAICRAGRVGRAGSTIWTLNLHNPICSEKKLVKWYICSITF